MAQRARPTLIAALALVCSACPLPQVHFQAVDLRQGEPAPPSTILVGQHVVVRIRNGGGPDGNRDLRWTHLDVFPAGTIIRGGWFKVAGRFDVCEGPIRLIRDRQGEGYILGGLDYERGARCTGASFSGPAFTSLWLGPVCHLGDCDSFRIANADWPPKSER